MGRPVHDKLTLAFHGAAQTVTGSKHLLTAGGKKILVDAGLFQGLKRLRELNWKRPAFNPRSVDRVVLTHAHLDHVGYLPRLVRLGLSAPVHCTLAASHIAELVLLDSAKIQEEDARYANKKKYSKHDPALPLYTAADARKALRLRRGQSYRRWFELGGGVRAKYHNAGHVLGSSFVELSIPAAGREVRIVFSGDIGRYGMPLHPDPQPLPACDLLICESTYGDRLHTRRTAEDQLRGPLRKAFRRGGIVLVPAFAVGRSQQITLILRRLMKSGEIPEVPIHIDSPMAVNATNIYSKFLNRRNVDPDVYEDGRLRLFPGRVHLHKKVSESKRLGDLDGPRVIISSSGMLTGGRVLHHLRRLAPNPENLIVLIGYQAEGTRGRALLEGNKTVKMHGGRVPVRARTVSIEGMSGHADRNELFRWVSSAPRPPRTVFLVHGQPRSSRRFASYLRRKLGVHCEVPGLGARFDLNDVLKR
ncbi:MAG: MBL fold metallo-hydrolase [Acidobacteriota bacterium]|nr:MBL fold metallo-hydrolase [Acidobacteriota bacterium]